MATTRDGATITRQLAMIRLAIRRHLLVRVYLRCTRLTPALYSGEL